LFINNAPDNIKIGVKYRADESLMAH